MAGRPGDRPGREGSDRVTLMTGTEKWLTAWSSGWPWPVGPRGGDRLDPGAGRRPARRPGGRLHDRGHRGRSTSAPGAAASTRSATRTRDQPADALVAADFRRWASPSYGDSTSSARSTATPANDPCTSTPPANAYWSYWYADAGPTRGPTANSRCREPQLPAGQCRGLGIRRADTGASPPPSLPVSRAHSGPSQRLRDAGHRADRRPPLLLPAGRPRWPRPPASTGGSRQELAGGSVRPPAGPGAARVGARPSVGAGDRRGSALEADGTASAPPGSRPVAPSPRYEPAARRRPPDQGGSSASAPRMPRIVDAAPTVAAAAAHPVADPSVIGAVAVLLWPRRPGSSPGAGAGPADVSARTHRWSLPAAAGAADASPRRLVDLGPRAGRGGQPDHQPPAAGAGPRRPRPGGGQPTERGAVGPGFQVLPVPGLHRHGHPGGLPVGLRG